MNEIKKIEEWQKTKDPKLFKDLMNFYSPQVRGVVGKYRTTGQNTDTLKTEANTQLIRALRTYKPTAGTQPSTHIYNYLKKVQRHASESLMSGHIPEARSMQLSTYKIVKENLHDRLGYEPNAKDMAEEMKWSVKEVSRAENELSGETTASGADFDFYGNSTQQKTVDKQNADYIYHSLTGPEKTVFEYTFGYGGKPKIDKNKDIATAMGTNEMFITRKKKGIAKKIREARF